jgi:hypothetical protein
MNTRRVGTHLLSTLLLLLWGGVMLYFYVGGRLVHYLPPDGIFRPMVLWSGIGMVVLALYNLATIGAKEADCCEHDHDHDDGHGHGHDHAHKVGCCDHDHGHGHSHGHDEGHSHAHDHGHAHAHAHKAGECCSHDDHHDHGHAHAAAHDHAHEHGECAHGVGHTDHSHFDEDPMKAQRPPGHAHGILEESGAFGRLIAILLLAVPVTYAAVRSPDRYSANAVINKGLYSQSYGEGARAEQFSLKKDVAAASETGAVAAPPSSPAVAEMPPDPSKGPAPAVNTKEVEKQAAKGGAETKSYGSFSLADLKAQVPQSPEGNFMLEVPELYYTAGDKEVQGVLTGQPIETIAQVLPEKVNNEKGTRLRIFRLLVQCCAADARPYSIPVEFGKPAPTNYKDMSWVKVTGKMTYKKEGDQTVPVIEATNITEAAEPANAMVY